MIATFKNRETEKVWRGIISNRLPVKIQKTARRKLNHIHSAINLNDLRVPPGNRLHKLKGDKKELYSISINDQWRICFRWVDGNAYEINITDYHD